MPIFEYICRHCHHHFEAIVSASRPAACPACHGSPLDKQPSTFAVASKSSASPSQAPVACGACGDPRGPGSCGLD